MSWWFWGGAAAGVAARHLANKRKLSQAEQQLELATNRISANAVAPPLAAETWFTAPGLFTFGLPRSFSPRDVRSLGGRQAPLLAVDGGSGHSGLWFAVFDEHLSVEVTSGHSVWVTVVNAEGYRRAVQSWGGTVTTGPVPILIAGERGVWSAIDTYEQGQHIRRFSVLTMHNGAPYEVMMGGPGLISTQATVQAYADAFWTAIGSWQWADTVGQSPVQRSDAPHAVPLTHEQIYGQTSSSQQLHASSADGDEEYRVWNAENAISVGPIAQPLRADEVFAVKDLFSFKLPGNYGPAPEEILSQWQRTWDSAPLIAITDHRAVEFSFLMAVFSGPSEYQLFNSLGSHSLWAMVVKADEFRQKAQRSFAVTRGPDAILVDGERGIFYSARSISNDGIEDRKWVANAVHAYKCYQVMMFVLPGAEARYADAFWTAIGSWKWASPLG